MAGSSLVKPGHDDGGSEAQLAMARPTTFAISATFFLPIFRICATLFSRNDNAAERAQVNEADNGNEEGSGRSGGVDAREAI
jgi:hypothetical protein